MTALNRNTILALLALLPASLQGQVISVLDDAEPISVIGSEGIISNLEQPSDTLQTQFLDWDSILGDFEDIRTVSERELQRRIEAGRNAREGRTADGVPSVIDENGTDLYMLTEEGIAHYLALLAPAYMQETSADVVKWIRYYAYENRKRTATMFGRYAKWENYIKDVFRTAGVPEETAALCMVESACTYTATSWAGAKGMWQIMPATARQWGLTVNDDKDQRTDPVASTQTAAKILADDYALCGDWTLAIAGYNCGMGRITQAVKQRGSKEWKTVSPSLPKETRQYIPSLLAIHYVWSYRDRLGIKI